MDIILLIFMIALGACVGSFLNVVIWRLPRGESIVFPPSHCPSCGKPIAWYDNIPLVSWFALRGHCRACNVAISPRYLLIEGVILLGAGVGADRLRRRIGREEPEPQIAAPVAPA